MRPHRWGNRPKPQTKTDTRLYRPLAANAKGFPFSRSPRVHRRALAPSPRDGKRHQDLRALMLANQKPATFRSPASTITAPLSSSCPRRCLKSATRSIAFRCLLKHARCPPTSGAGSSISSRAARVIKTVTRDGPYCMANRTPRFVSHPGLPIDERLVASLKSENAKRPAGSGALETHSQPRQPQLRSFRSGMIAI